MFNRDYKWWIFRFQVHSPKSNRVKSWWGSWVFLGSSSVAIKASPLDWNSSRSLATGEVADKWTGLSSISPYGVVNYWRILQILWFFSYIHYGTGVRTWTSYVVHWLRPAQTESALPRGVWNVAQKPCRGYSQTGSAQERQGPGRRQKFPLLVSEAAQVEWQSHFKWNKLWIITDEFEMMNWNSIFVGIPKRWYKNRFFWLWLVVAVTFNALRWLLG